MNADKYFIFTKDRDSIINQSNSYNSDLIINYFKIKLNLLDLGFFETMILRGYVRKGEYHDCR